MTESGGSSKGGLACSAESPGRSRRSAGPSAWSGSGSVRSSPRRCASSATRRGRSSYANTRISLGRGLPGIDRRNSCATPAPSVGEWPGAPSARATPRGPARTRWRPVDDGPTGSEVARAGWLLHPPRARPRPRPGPGGPRRERIGVRACLRWPKRSRSRPRFSPVDVMDALPCGHETWRPVSPETASRCLEVLASDSNCLLL